jgi:hypothetical protein
MEFLPPDGWPTPWGECPRTPDFAAIANAAPMISPPQSGPRRCRQVAPRRPRNWARYHASGGLPNPTRLSEQNLAMRLYLRHNCWRLAAKLSEVEMMVLATGHPSDLEEHDPSGCTVAPTSFREADRSTIAGRQYESGVGS